MVEYLPVYGTGIKFGFNFTCLKIFNNDHYKQPTVKG